MCACVCVCVCVCCSVLQSQVDCLSRDLADCQKEAEQSRTASTLLEQQLKGGSTCHDSDSMYLNTL